MMHLADMFKHLRFSGGRQLPLLVCYCNGIHLNAVIVQVQHQQLLFIAHSSTVMLNEQGMMAMLDDLKQQTDELPTRALMLHERMATALLELPGAEQVQLAEDKIANIVQWEMETLYGDQVAAWKSGALLISLGKLSTQQRDDLLILQNQQRESASGFGGKVQRLGELGIDEGILEATDVEQALQLQDELTDINAPILSGYQLSEDLSKVYATAISDQDRQRCLRLFAHAGIRLLGFYPFSTVLELIPQDAGHISVCLENTAQTLCAEIQDSSLVNLEIMNRQERALLDSEIDALLHSCYRSSRLWYHWSRSEVKEHAGNSIKHLFGAAPEALEQLDSELFSQLNDMNSDALPMLALAQSHFFSEANNNIPFVSGTLPEPPFYKRAHVQFATTGLLILLTLLGSDLYFRHQRDDAEQVLSDLKLKIRDKSKSNKERKRDNRAYGKLDQEYIQLKQTYQDLQQGKQAIEDNLIKRQQFIRAFLPQLIESIDQDAVLEEISEDSWYVFRISGWALNQTAINRLESRLTSSLQAFNMRISKTPSTLIDQGALNGAYRFDFEIIRNEL